MRRYLITTGYWYTLIPCLASGLAFVELHHSNALSDCLFRAPGVRNANSTANINGLAIGFPLITAGKKVVAVLLD